jgi:hypothetical protein
MMNPAVTAASIVLPQWLGAAAAFWLVWWAALTRDGPAFRVIALTLAIVPALLTPLLTIYIQSAQLPVSSIGFLYAAVLFVVEVCRALFLVVWAIVSKDRPGLRIGGAVIAGLLVLHVVAAGVVMVAMNGRL